MARDFVQFDYINNSEKNKLKVSFAVIHFSKVDLYQDQELIFGFGFELTDFSRKATPDLIL